MIAKRLAAGLFAALVLVFGGVGGATAAWAGSGVSTSYAASQQATRTERLVGLGDSVTSGYQSDISYLQALAGSLTTAHTATEAENFGIPGLTTTGLLAQLNLTSVQATLEQADVVVITIGANDFAINDATAPGLAGQLATLHDNVARILSEVRADAPNARIVLTGYWNAFTDASVSGADQEYTDSAMGLTMQINTVLQQDASDAVVGYADLIAAFDHAGTGWTALLADDGDHPNAAGHQVIAAAIKTILTQPTQS